MADKWSVYEVSLCPIIHNYFRFITALPGSGNNDHSAFSFLLSPVALTYIVLASYSVSGSNSSLILASIPRD